MACFITILPQKQIIEARNGDTLLSALRQAGKIPDAPCGGEGRCGKCRVIVGGAEALACQTIVDRDMTVTIPTADSHIILTEPIAACHISVTPSQGYLLAFDIGTTTVVGYLLEGPTRKILATAGAQNPQSPFGADVISRIRHALQGQMEPLTQSIRDCLAQLTLELCRGANIAADDIGFVCAVGNPAMQQLLLGIPVDNLAKVPFAPALTEVKTIPARDILPLWEKASFFIVPDIAGFVGADTVACVLACGQNIREEMTLIVDIGTNGEMTLGNRQKMVACSAAAGPALEGAMIRFGMRGQTGAIDHVRLENGQIRCSVIGGGTAVGICGSGLIDGVAVALTLGLINERGKILTDDGLIHLTDGIFLTQDDIRQVQLAKGAIAAGIRLMASQMDIPLSQIQQVFLAGAFGTYTDPKSACRIGLLPPELESKITAVGNAAGSGAILLASDQNARQQAQRIAADTQALELSALPEFPRCFAENMRF